MPAGNKIRVLIADDEAPARARLRHLLKEDPDVEVAAECCNGREAVEAIQRDRPDLVFLDVQMPRLNGVQVCQALTGSGTPLPLIVFVTAYDQFAVQAFEVHALDYLLKPFDRERFQRALTHAREQMRRDRAGDTDARLAALLEDLRVPPAKPNRLVFKEDGRVIFLTPESIDWIEADGNYVRLHAGQESHYVRETLTSLETQLSPDKFMRISRSMLVNLERIKELQPLFYGDYAVVLRDGSKLNMSRNYRDRLEAMLARKV